MHTVKMDVRWWPVPLALGLWGLSLLVIWAVIDWPHQSLKLVSSFGATGILVAVLLAWFLFFAGFSRKTKWFGLAALLGLSLFVGNFVEIREVDGNVLPIPAWTWTPKEHERLAATTMTANEAAPPVIASTKRDFPRFLGADGSGKVTTTRLIRDWQNQMPEERWRIPVGAAWSGFAVVGDRVVTQEQRGETEMVTCYALADGQKIWAHGDARFFASTVGGDGPRSTPTIAAGKVYTMGALGLLNCLDLNTGRLLWQRDVAEEHKATAPRWGYSSSPLVLSTESRTLVVVSPGGPENRSLVAYNALDGAFVWGGGTAPPGYSSPQHANLAGQDMVLIFNNGSVAGHDSSNGQVLWEVPWEPDKPSVANPRVLSGDRVLVSAGYGLGAKMFRVSEGEGTFQTELVYESPRLKAKFANFVTHDGFAYGLDDGILTCMNVETGERAWKKGRYGHGQLLLVGDLLLIQAEDGEVHMVAARPDSHESLGQIPVLSGKSWNSPALAGNLLLVRNHKEAVCLELPVE